DSRPPAGAAKIPEIPGLVVGPACMARVAAWDSIGSGSFAMSSRPGTADELRRQAVALFGGGAVAGLSDGELLERFVRREDSGDVEAAEAAFGALVARHGRMVLGVCRRALRDRGEAEEAFQATFLVLARKAGSV